MKKQKILKIKKTFVSFNLKDNKLMQEILNAFYWIKEAHSNYYNNYHEADINEYNCDDLKDGLNGIILEFEDYKKVWAFIPNKYFDAYNDAEDMIWHINREIEDFEYQNYREEYGFDRAKSKFWYLFED